MSLDPLREPSVPLDGATLLTGDYYIFLEGPGDILYVEFFLNEESVTFEKVCPWDFRSSNAPGVESPALPYSTGGLSTGAHTISAVVTFTDGTVVPVVANWFKF